MTSMKPVYQFEASAVRQREWQVCYQLTIVVLELLAHWINYEVYFKNKSVPMALSLLQCLLSAHIIALMI